jgi:hypothetical protein
MMGKTASGRVDDHSLGSLQLDQTAVTARSLLLALFQQNSVLLLLLLPLLHERIPLIKM